MSFDYDMNMKAIQDWSYTMTRIFTEATAAFAALHAALQGVSNLPSRECVAPVITEVVTPAEPAEDPKLVSQEHLLVHDTRFSTAIIPTREQCKQIADEVLGKEVMPIREYYNRFRQRCMDMRLVRLNEKGMRHYAYSVGAIKKDAYTDAGMNKQRTIGYRK